MFSFTQDVPIDAAMYRRITDGLGSAPPDGLIVHLATERPEGGLRYTDVWESQEHYERFVEERLHPVVHELLSQIFGEHLPPEPERTPLAVIHAWVGGDGHDGVATRVGYSAVRSDESAPRT